MIVAGDDGPTFRDLALQADRNAYGYFDAADGNVVVAPDDQRLLRVICALVAGVACRLRLTSPIASQPTELVPAHAWDIGDLWITGSARFRCSLSRRLHRDENLQALRERPDKARWSRVAG